MANSFVRYTGNGATTAYSISYSYRDAADLSVTINGVATTSYTLNGAGSTLTFDTAPVNASSIEIRRKTSQTSRLTDYAAGSVLTENDLDTDSEQAFFMSQEAIDDAGDVIKLSNTDFQWDTQSKRLKNVADPVDNTDAVNKQFISTNLPNITTVSGISADVTTVAGISADVTSVANDATDIGLVATNIGSVNTVAADITKVIAVANDLAEAVSEIETVADDLNEATSEIDTVSNSIANVDTVGTNIANVNTVAGIDANVTTVAGISADVTSVAGISTAVTNVNSNSTNINAVNTNSANINTVAGIDTDVTTVAGISSDVTTVAGISSAVSAVNSNSTNINAVNTNATNINTVAGNDTNITTVAGADADISTVATAVDNVNTVADNIAGVNSFADRYRIAVSDPSTSLDEGDLAFNTTDNNLKFYNGSAWTSISPGIANVVEDTTPQLGGNLDLNSNNITGTGAINITGTLTGTTFSGSGASLTSIPNSALVGTGAITINGSAVSLGGSVTVGETKPTISSLTPSTIPNDATTIVIAGTNFEATPNVELIASTGAITYPNSVVRNSNIQLTINVTLGTDGTYFVRVENPDGNAVRTATASLTVSDAPTWSTASGSVGSYAGNFSGTLMTLSASSDSTVAYSETTSNLTTAGVSLNTSSGALTTSDFGGSSTTPTTYNFTIRATDAEAQTADRSFSISSTFGATGGGQFN